MPAVIVPAIVAVIPAVASVMAAASRLWQASNIDDVATPDRAGHIAIEFAAAAFELDIVEADAEAARAELTDAEVIVDVDVAKPGPVALALDGTSATLQGIPFQLAHFPGPLAPLVGAVIASVPATPVVMAD